ncbi:MAG TPA: serine hydrolase domain-containing protein [Pyrinomonadaceae bacterium]|nr:serine hydrolase domain-containing protein [Pyrinomonadaceae bacterium]
MKIRVKTPKRTTHRFLFGCLLIFILCPVAALADKVDDYVRAQMTERHVPGAAFAVIIKGRVIKMKGYGMASVEFDAPVTVDTVFEIGSVSKQMTAAAILLLVEDGKVKLDERISACLPNTPYAWKDVTVRNLLTHSSGIKSYTSLDGFELSRRLTADQFIAKLATHPLEFTPGERNIYSNSGFNLLAFIVEARSGMKYIEFMRKRIFGPLGMTKTTDRDPQFIVKYRANGYEWERDHLAGRDASLTDLTGAGSIVSTIGDMVKWSKAVGSESFLKQSSRTEWWKKFVFNSGKESPYGFGWRISEIRSHRLIGHTGQTAGFGSAHFRYPDADTIVIALTNIGENGVGGAIAAGVAKLYMPSISIRAMKLVANPDTVRARKVLDALVARLSNKPDGPLMTKQLIQNLSTQRAKEANNRIASFGATRSVELVGIERTDGKDYYLYRAAAGRRLFLWRLAFDADLKISEMNLDDEE